MKAADPPAVTVIMALSAIIVSIAAWMKSHSVLGTGVGVGMGVLVGLGVGVKVGNGVAVGLGVGVDTTGTGVTVGIDAIAVATRSSTICSTSASDEPSQATVKVMTTRQADSINFAFI